MVSVAGQVLVGIIHVGLLELDLSECLVVVATMDLNGTDSRYKQLVGHVKVVAKKAVTCFKIHQEHALALSNRRERRCICIIFWSFGQRR